MNDFVMGAGFGYEEGFEDGYEDNQFESFEESFEDGFGSLTSEDLEDMYAREERPEDLVEQFTSTSTQSCAPEMISLATDELDRKKPFESFVDRYIENINQSRCQQIVNTGGFKCDRF